MQAQVVLMPTESKKLIAQAILSMPKVQNALENGIVAMHPSSSTLLIYELIFGKRPEGLWVCGCITQKGLYGSRESEELISTIKVGPSAPDPRLAFPGSFFIERGVLMENTPLGEILDKMGENDIYIKGVNAVDAQGNVGVLIGNPHGGGGTIGMVQAAKKKKGFSILAPVGLEKLIPVSIMDACKAASRKASMVMGTPCDLFPVSGERIDEIDAIRILSGAKATMIAAGGLGGAEGAIVLAIDGNDDQVAKAYEYARNAKGASLPVFYPDSAHERA